MPIKKSLKEESAAIGKEEKIDLAISEPVEVVLEKKSENPYLIPISVVIAGLLISAAILYKDRVPASGGGSTGDTATSVPTSIGLKSSDFDACMKKKQFGQKIQDQANDAAKSGGQGTPFSIVIAPNGKMTTIDGARPYEDVKKAIDEALASDPNTLPSAKEKESPIYNLQPVTTADHIRGNPNALIKIVEFADLQCPFCQFFHDTMQQVMAEYGTKGQVAWVYRHFPLTSIHRYALPWAEESECANQIGGPEKFWSYIDTRFKNQGG